MSVFGLGLLPTLNGILACGTCFGEPNSPMSQGARAGVLLLLGVIVFVLAAIAGMAIFWSQRAKMLDASAEFDQKPAMDVHGLFDRPPPRA